jgi:hypothetical protein
VLNVSLAALVASPVLLGGQLVSLPVFAGAAAPFSITRQQLDARCVGFRARSPGQVLDTAAPWTSPGSHPVTNRTFGMPL